MEWIKVDDRLPKNSTLVLLYNAAQLVPVVGSHYGNRRFGYHKSCFHPTNGQHNNDMPDIVWIEDIFTERITHWMPLPEPPKRINNEIRV